MTAFVSVAPGQWARVPGPTVNYPAPAPKGWAKVAAWWKSVVS